jgi:hypothetical protein
MGTPGIPPTSFPTAIDQPLQQTGPYRFTKADRAYIDSQILALEVYAKSIANGQLLFSLSQSCTVGGTIASTASAGIGVITLTGSPAAAFTYTLPTGAGIYQIVNNTGQYVSVTSGGNKIIVGSNALITTDGTTVYGPSSSVVQRLNFGTTGTSIVGIGTDTTVFLDQSAGQGTYPMPVGCVDRQRITLIDSVTTTGGSWGTHPPILSVTGGTKIQNSASIGTYSTTSTTVEAIGGNSISYTYGLAENAWFLN